MANTRRRLDAATARALATAAGVDPRSIVRTYAGMPVRGVAGKRARLALVRAGLLAPSPDDQLAAFTIDPRSAA